jgi:hypothetical protein
VAKTLTGARLLFDIRGFLPEEYVDSGNWRRGGLLFRMTKAAERWLFRSADGFVVLTDRAREMLFPDGAAGKPVEMIPCCISAGTAARRPRAVRAELDVSGVSYSSTSAARRVLPDARNGGASPSRVSEPQFRARADAGTGGADGRGLERAGFGAVSA